jgi:hypothetical protein
MKKFLFTTLFLSSLFFSANSQYFKHFKPYHNKLKFETEISSGIKLYEDIETVDLDLCGKIKYRPFKKMFFGVYGNYSPNISKGNYPWGFGGILAVPNYHEESETEFKFGLEKNLEKNFAGSFSLSGSEKILENFYGGFEINGKWDPNRKTNIVFEAKILGKYIFGK